MRAALTIAGVELRRFLRDRSNIFFVFLFPLLLVVLIGSQFGGDGPDGRVAIAGGDSLRSALAEELRADDVEVWYDDAGTVRDELARGRADVALFVGDDDEQAYAAGDDLDLQLVGAPQATAAATAQRVRAAVQRLTAERSQVAALAAAGIEPAAAAESLDRAATMGSPPRLEVTSEDALSEELDGLGQFDLGAASQLLLFVFLSSLSGASALIQSRRNGVLARTVAAPVSVGQAIAGQGLGRFTLGMVQGLYLMVGTALLFDVDWGSWPAALLVLTVFAAVAAAVAMVLGSVMDNEGAANGLAVGAGLVLGALGGCMTPLEFFPDTLRQVAHVTPHAWGYEAFAEVQRRGGGVVDVLPQVAVLAAMAAGLLALGAWLLRRSLDRAM